MGSIDIPPFLREKMKERIQKEKSDKIPPFLKKKEDGSTLEDGVSPTSLQSKEEPKYVIPADILNQTSEALKQYQATGVKSPFLTDNDQIHIAAENYNTKKLKAEDIDVLVKTPFGIEKGLYNLTSPAAKEDFADRHNRPKMADNVNEITSLVRQYPVQSKDPEIISAFSEDNINGIIKIKDSIIEQLQKKQPQKAVVTTRGFTPIESVGGTSKEVDDEIQKVNQVFADYVDNIHARNILNNIREGADLLDSDLKSIGQAREKMVLGNNSFKQRQLLASHENKVYQEQLQKVVDSDFPNFLKKSAEIKLNDNYLATENINYDREKAGLETVLNSLQMQYDDIATKVMTTNPELQPQADKLYDQINLYLSKYKTLDDRPEYADVRLSKVSRLIGDEIAKKSKGYVTAITANDIRNAVVDIDKENAGFLEKYAGDIDYLQKHNEQIPMAGFPGGLRSGLIKIGENIESRFGFGEGKIEKAARQQSEQYNTGIKGTGFTEPTRIVFDKNDQAFKELPNEDYGKINWNNTFRFLGKSTPALAEFILLDKGFAKAAKLVNTVGVEGLLTLSTKAAALKGIEITAEELAAARAALSIGEKTQNAAGLFGALTVSGHDQNRRVAEDLVDDTSSLGEAKKDIVANLMNLSSFAAFRLAGISPSAVMERAFQRNIGNDAVRLLEKNGWKLTEEQTENWFKNAALPKLKALGSAMGQNVLQGVKLGGAMVLDENTRSLIGKIVNPDKSEFPSLKDDANILLNQVILMTAAGLPQLVGAGFTPSNKDALYDAGLNAPRKIFQINKMFENGEIDRLEADKAISVINTISEEVNNVQDLKNDNGLPLTVKQKRDIAVEEFRKRAAEKIKSEDKDFDAEQIVSDADKSIGEIKADNRFESAGDDPLVKIINGDLKEIGVDEKSTPVELVAADTSDPAIKVGAEGEISKPVALTVTPRTQVEREGLLNQQLIIKEENGRKSNYKYKPVSFKDPLTGAEENLKAYQVKDRMTERHGLLEKLVNCLTLP